MTLDLSVIGQAVWSVVLVVVTAFVTLLVERRPRLVVYYGSIGSFQLPAPGPGKPALGVNTHTVVVLNAGRLAAHNVRVPHNGPLAAANVHVSVFPPVANTRETLPGGQEVIVIPTLPPDQQVTLSYLYFPPLTFNLINLQISSDEGMARQLNVLPTPQPRRWWVILRRTLVAVGATAIVLALFQAARFALGQPG